MGRFFKLAYTPELRITVEELAENFDIPMKLGLREKFGILDNLIVNAYKHDKDLQTYYKKQYDSELVRHSRSLTRTNAAQ
jgi:hypothetical protein